MRIIKIFINLLSTTSKYFTVSITNFCQIEPEIYVHVYILKIKKKINFHPNLAQACAPSREHLAAVSPMPANTKTFPCKKS